MKTIKTPSKRKWSLLAYIAGDNSLSEFALTDVQEMCDEGSSADMHVGVQVDTEGDFDGLVRYEITPKDHTGKGHRMIIERLPEDDSGAPECLTEFIAWGLSRYPAEKKIGVVWSHGSGFRMKRRDAGVDDSSGNSMDMSEIISGLTKGGINKKNKLTIIGFDACLMSMLEVAHHLKDHAEILVGSQQTEPGNGWPYNKVLKSMKTTNDKRRMASAIVEEYIKYYKRPVSHEPNVTQAAIETGKTPAAVRSLSALGKYMKQMVKNNPIKTKLNMLRLNSQNFEMTDYIDAIDFAKKLSGQFSDPVLKTLCSGVINSCRKCIIVSKKFGYGVRNANGLSIWFPGSRDLYFEYRSKYLQLSSNTGGSGWVDFLDEFYSI